MMKRYTLSSLITRLASFEEALAEKMDAKGYAEAAEKARRHASEIREVRDFIIVEMTLEPIETLDPMEFLDEVATPGDVEGLRRRVYTKIAEDVEPVSGELADLLRRLSS